jgi:two-component system chemotaxis response regulator CheY
MRLLLVEDVHLTARATLVDLARLGFSHVDHAPDAEEAICLLAQHTYDIVLIDWTLPRTSGLELLFLMRRSARYARTPILMLSDVPTRTDVAHTATTGATALIAKPADPRTLEDHLHAFLPAFA